MSNLTKICYTICIACIVIGTTISIVLIWGGLDNVVAWKSLGTLAVFFCASVVTLAVHSTFFAMRPRPDVNRRRSSRNDLDPYDSEINIERD